MTYYHIRSSTASSSLDETSPPDDKVFVVCFIPIAFVFVILITCCCSFSLICRRRAAAAAVAAPHASLPYSAGVEPEFFQALPIFVYSLEASDDKAECAVCLMEVVDGEKGRLLPRCGHRFHAGCIDMWFHSHSTCPLCRSPVELEEDQDLPVL